VLHLCVGAALFPLGGANGFRGAILVGVVVGVDVRCVFASCVVAFVFVSCVGVVGFLCVAFVVAAFCVNWALSIAFAA
jgi:hypothetical protein